MSPYPLLTVIATFRGTEENPHAGNAPAEVLLVVFIMIVIWGVFRITSKRRQ